ncbi:serine threonine-protein kinase [Physocladia obscura]|uniref:Serine threonine-protein kinase n=1 Tax=Physocladia obscura TaxID=109957 RepID=A0AAD5SSV2_9FUNG|nr:serine threonine-protein kinase [Physocladia obscura]
MAAKRVHRDTSEQTPNSTPRALARIFKHVPQAVDDSESDPLSDSETIRFSIANNITDMNAAYKQPFSHTPQKLHIHSNGERALDLRFELPESNDSKYLKLRQKPHDTALNLPQVGISPQISSDYVIDDKVTANIEFPLVSNASNTAQTLDAQSSKNGNIPIEHLHAVLAPLKLNSSEIPQIALNSLNKHVSVFTTLLTRSSKSSSSTAVVASVNASANINSHITHSAVDRVIDDSSKLRAAKNSILTEKITTLLQSSISSPHDLNRIYDVAQSSPNKTEYISINSSFGKNLPAFENHRKNDDEQKEGNALFLFENPTVEISHNILPLIGMNCVLQGNDDLETTFPFPDEKSIDSFAQASTASVSDNNHNSNDDSDSDSDDEGQIFQASLSVQIPTTNELQKHSTSRSSLAKEIRKNFNLSVAIPAAGSPRPPLRNVSKTDIAGNTLSFSRSPSAATSSLIETNRRTSNSSLAARVTTTAAFQYGFPIISPARGSSDSNGKSLRNVSFGDASSLNRQFHQVSSSTSSSALGSQDDVFVPDRNFSPFSGSLSESWKVGTDSGLFKRNLSGVNVKRKDSITSAGSGVFSSSNSFVAPSPAASYLSMLAEKLAEPPRGTYFEGDQIGEWVLGHEIGHGSFSRVFEASPAAESTLCRHLPSGTTAAIKIVAKVATTTTNMSICTSSPWDVSATGERVGAAAADQDDVRRLLDHEIEIWSMLEHPNVLGMIQMMDVDDAIFVVSELAQGGTLLDYIIKHARLQERETKKLFKQVVDAVLYLHSIAGVVHRDIKCENILLMESSPPVDYVDTDNWVPTLKLADFGLSEKIKLANTDTSLESPATLMSSEPIFCIGSVHYCAPEELSSPRVPANSAAGDVWSLGCVLYAMLSGSLPFNDEYAPRLQMAIRRGNYDVGRLLKTGISEAGIALIQGMLCVNVESRLKIQNVANHEFFNE